MRIKVAKVARWAPRLHEYVKASLDSVTSEDQIDEILDSRDADPFDKSWVELDAALSGMKATLGKTAQKKLKNFSDKERKDCYQYVIRACHSSELAAYVSDDIELVLECLAVGLTPPFLRSLINSYVLGKIPNALEAVEHLPKEIDWLE